MKRVVVVAAVAAALVGTATITGATAGTRGSPAAPAATLSIPLVFSSPQLKSCYPQAKATVTVALTTDATGKDTFRISGRNLRPSTAFTVFLVQQAAAPFGAAEYIGDFSTNRLGNGSNTFTLIVGEAFAFNNATGSRTNLNRIGFWFADPRDDNLCLGNGAPVTGFDGDASAGVQMMNSGARVLP